MKCTVILCNILLLVALNAFASDMSWNGWKGNQGWGMESVYQKKYDPKGLVMISGAVVSIERITPAKGMGTGVAVELKTAEETISVHLGPTWYIERLDYRISVGDKLEVKGVKTLFSAQPAVIAAEIRNGNRFLILRDNMGTPVWSGWGWKR